MQLPRRERHALGAGGPPSRVVTHTFDVEELLASTWLGVLATGSSRPNVLIQCPASKIAALTDRLAAWAIHPCAVCTVSSGRLRLPAAPGGTLLTHDLAALTVAQQIELFDWIAGDGGRTQVVGITSVALGSRVEAGHFLQALFCRLNIVQARAAAD